MSGLTPQLRAELDEFASRHELTPREYDVLFLLVGGRSTVAAIADRLGLSQNTVHNHFKNVFRRTATNSKAGLLSLFINETMGRRAGYECYLRRPQVLLVERDEADRQPIREALEQRGMRVLEESDSTFALARIAEHKIDVVVADGSLPGNGGSGVLNDVRQRYGRHPGVMITSAEPTQSAQEWVERGAAAVFDKPVSLDRLVFSVLEYFVGSAYEHNRLVRVDTELPAKVSDEMDAALDNLGFGGAFVAYPDQQLRQLDPLDVGASVSLRFSLHDGSPIEVDSEIRWMRRNARPSLPAGMGVRFLNLKETDRRSVEDYVRRQKLSALSPVGLPGERVPSAG